MTAAERDISAFFGADGTIQPITDKEFALFQGLIHREAGIYLSQVKKALLVGRLTRRLRELGLRTFGAYYRRVVEEDGGERARMLDCICTNETHFFREPQQFAFLEQHVFPDWKTRALSGLRARRIRAWSAACSTGEEPYSLAMILLCHFPQTSGWEVEILATDLSIRALKRAQAGVWSLENAARIPSTYLRKFMLKGTRSQAGKMRAGPEIRSAVRFHRLNLNDEYYPALGPFDLVFCRNVLIYFDAGTKSRVIDRLLNHVAPTGYLLLGHAESLSNVTDRVRSVGPMVYVPLQDFEVANRRARSRGNMPER
ncbi:MAG TPA: protein-glutamate O-methyltransferase CheR [Blastocatellia bacterium]|nr:protein-glutamate O-methyltransferase CheR [Blastocatellia bacterium]